jgi:hypothetical protein
MPASRDWRPEFLGLLRTFPFLFLFPFPLYSFSFPLLPFPPFPSIFFVLHQFLPSKTMKTKEWKEKNQKTGCITSRAGRAFGLSKWTGLICGRVSRR